MKLGLLGGIGPEATGNFYLKLIQELQEQNLINDNSDFPQIMINSIPAPELIFDKIKDDDLSFYYKGLIELDEQNPDVIVMVCNTIHLFHKSLQSKIKTDLVDLKGEIFNKLKESGTKKITIFATPSTIKLGLYLFEGIDYLNPTQEELKEMSHAVFNFNKGVDKEIQKQKVLDIAQKYISLGSDLILLGCTEFGVMLENEKIPKLNTMDVLLEVIIKKYKKIKSI